MSIPIWKIKDVVEIIRRRQLNEFDANILVSGSRGNGKSTLISKMLYRLGNFNPYLHQVYSQEDVIRLIESQKFGLVFDDEAINSGYKRDFYKEGQKKLIKMLNMYRDNFNVYASAIPKFYSLDKDLRELVKFHFHVIGRGVAVFHMAHNDSLYSDDSWDVSYNKKIEDGWKKKILKNPNFRPPFNKLTTFVGYLVFSKLTKNQERIYKLVKKTKRKIIFDKEKSIEENKDEIKFDFYKNLIEMIRKGKIENNNEVLKICLSNGKKYRSVMTKLGEILRQEGDTKTLKDYLEKRIEKKIVSLKNPPSLVITNSGEIENFVSKNRKILKVPII